MGGINMVTLMSKRFHLWVYFQQNIRLTSWKHFCLTIIINYTYIADGEEGTIYYMGDHQQCLVWQLWQVWHIQTQVCPFVSTEESDRMRFEKFHVNKFCVLPCSASTWHVTEQGRHWLKVGLVGLNNLGWQISWQ